MNSYMSFNVINKPQNQTPSLDLLVVFFESNPPLNQIFPLKRLHFFKNNVFKHIYNQTFQIWLNCFPNYLFLLIHQKVHRLWFGNGRCMIVISQCLHVTTIVLKILLQHYSYIQHDDINDTCDTHVSYKYI